MNSNFLITGLLLILLTCSAAFAQVPGDQSPWVNGPLVEVTANGSVAHVPKEKLKILPFGFPVFQFITIKQRDTEQRWIISASVISSNSGNNVSDAAVYVRYDNGLWKLAALSNLKGNVLFEISDQATALGKPAKPVFLYIAQSITGLPGPVEGTYLRQYDLSIWMPAKKTSP